jgi:hypothetical protein
MSGKETAVHEGASLRVTKAEIREGDCDTITEKQFL